MAEVFPQNILYAVNALGSNQVEVPTAPNSDGLVGQYALTETHLYIYLGNSLNPQWVRLALDIWE